MFYSVFNNWRNRLKTYRLDKIRMSVGNADLEKSLSQGKSITEEQKKEIIDYWTPFLNSTRAKKMFDIRWFDVYNRTNVFGYDLKFYIPDGFYYGIIDTVFTDVKTAYSFDDKNLYDLYFHDAHQPRTIIHKINGLYLDDRYSLIDGKVAVAKCMENKNVIIKPSMLTVRGEGICVWKSSENSVEELKEVLSKYSNVVVQDLIEQHETLAMLNNSCLNTMRIVTLLWQNKVSVLSSVLIIGGENSKTNHLHGGGIVCAIMPSGRLQKYGFDGKLNQYEVHPKGQRLSDVVIPNYQECIDMVTSLAPRLSRISRILNWDLTIDKDGKPTLIEVNLTFGGSVQIAAGPAFGNLTTEILNYATKKG